jgi:hypothetical protein
MKTRVMGVSPHRTSSPLQRKSPILTLFGPRPSRFAALQTDLKTHSARR